MIRVFPIDFLGQGAMLEPSDPYLHDLAIEFCRRELTEDVNLSHFGKCWVAAELDAKQRAGQVLGLTGYVLKPDVPVMRAVSVEALYAMANRYNDYLADNGARGKETFIHIARNEKPEQKCPGFAEVLKFWEAKLADRVVVKVR